MTHSNSAPELLLCPFCGGEAEYYKNAIEPVACCWGTNENCGHRGVMMNVEQWQTRTPSGDKAAALNALDMLEKNLNEEDRRFLSKLLKLIRNYIQGETE